MTSCRRSPQVPLGPPASPSDPCASVPPWYSCAEQSGDCRRRQLRWRQRRGFRRLRRWIRQQLPRGQRRLRRRSRLPRGRRELRLEQQKQQQIQRRRRPERRLLPHSDSADLHPQFAQARGGVAGKRLQYLSCRPPPPPALPGSLTYLFPTGLSKLPGHFALGGEAGQIYRLFISLKTHAYSGTPPLFLQCPDPQGSCPATKKKTLENNFTRGLSPRSLFLKLGSSVNNNPSPTASFPPRNLLQGKIV